MHDEAAIPISRLAAGTAQQKYPVYVMTTLPGPIPGIWLALFWIEFGADGSLYTAACVDASEILHGEGMRQPDGRVRFEYADEVALPTNLAKQHEYLSFHASGKINHPARGNQPLPEMTFKLNDQLVGTQSLCHHLIGHPGIYQPCGVPRANNILPFPDLYNKFPDARSIPYFTIEVTRFDGDPAPILKHCGLDTCVSFGLVTDTVTPYGRKGNNCQFFVRVKLLYGAAEGTDAWPDGHRIVHPQQVNVTQCRNP